MTYEYLCTACGHQWEAEQRISEPALVTCPVCQRDSARRQVSGGAGFLLKGGGWYADGYASARNGAAGSSKPSEGAAAKGDASTTAAPVKTAAATTSGAAPASPGGASAGSAGGASAGSPAAA